MVGASLKNENTALAHGYLNDNIYTMSVKVEFDLAQGVISAMEGSMIRYTTYRCLKAEDVFSLAVGIAFGQGMDSAIKKSIGRVGCRHVAALLIDCCHAVPRMLVALETGKRRATPRRRRRRSRRVIRSSGTYCETPEAAPVATVNPVSVNKTLCSNSFRESVMLIDIHIHTTRYSECSSLHPVDMAVAAKEAGLDGICLTEHQTVWSPRTWRPWPRRTPSRCSAALK